MFRFTWPLVYPSLYGSLPPVSTRFSLFRVLTSFVLPIHNQGVSLAPRQGRCPMENIPADYWLILCFSLTDFASCNGTFRWTFSRSFHFLSLSFVARVPLLISHRTYAIPLNSAIFPLFMSCNSLLPS